MTATGSRRERRRHRRVTRRIAVAYRVESSWDHAYATTLGAGGLFLEVERELERDTILIVRFRVSGAERVHEAPARVVWAHRDAEAGRQLGLGIAFTDASLTAQLARELEALVA